MTTALNVDLHCHSSVSDGTLAPQTVARRAADHGVDAWALTDHDEVAGQEVAAEDALLCRAGADKVAGTLE